MGRAHIRNSVLDHDDEKKPVATNSVGCHGYYFLTAYPQTTKMLPWRLSCTYLEQRIAVYGLVCGNGTSYEALWGTLFKTAILPRSKERLIQIGAYHAQ